MAQPARQKISRRPVHGVLLLDKPLGWSSNDALQKAKWLLRAEKAGHTGTLDPLATGLLPLCFGAATKFSQLSLDADKRYLATLKLGVTTDSGDAEETAQGLNQAAGFLRNGLFKRLHIHTVPTLHFVYDRTPERAADMNALIARAVASRSKDSEG